MKIPYTDQTYYFIHGMSDIPSRIGTVDEGTVNLIKYKIDGTVFNVNMRYMIKNNWNETCEVRPEYIFETAEKAIKKIEKLLYNEVKEKINFYRKKYKDIE